MSKNNPAFVVVFQSGDDNVQVLWHTAKDAWKNAANIVIEFMFEHAPDPETCIEGIFLVVNAIQTGDYQQAVETWNRIVCDDPMWRVWVYERDFRQEPQPDPAAYLQEHRENAASKRGLL